MAANHVSIFPVNEKPFERLIDEALEINVAKQRSKQPIGRDDQTPAPEKKQGEQQNDDGNRGNAPRGR